MNTRFGSISMQFGAALSLRSLVDRLWVHQCTVSAAESSVQTAPRGSSSGTTTSSSPTTTAATTRRTGRSLERRVSALRAGVTRSHSVCDADAAADDGGQAAGRGGPGSSPEAVAVAAVGLQCVLCVVHAALFPSPANQPVSCPNSLTSSTPCLANPLPRQVLLRLRHHCSQ